MSSIIGIINKKGRTLEPALVEKTMVPPVYWEPDDSGIWSRGPVALGCHMLYTTPGSLNEKLPHYHEESGCCITADARIDYREELAEELNLDWKDARNLPDSIFLLKAYQKWGRDCVKHFYGDFAFAIWDDRSQTLFAARDHFGCRPFYYFETEELFAFSSDIMGLMLMPGFSAKIDEMFLVDTLATIVPEKDKTAFETLFRLRPAHMLSIDRDAGLTTVRYWDLELKPAFTGLNETEAAAGLRQRFMKAVGERCRSAFPVGIELSGGLDSSAIACAASGVSNKENSLTAFSHTLSEEQKKHYYPFIDETGYAEIVAGTCHFKDHFRIHGEGSYGCLQVLSDFLDLCPMPYGQGFSLFSDLLYNSARKAGVRVLLSGFGGDEGVTSQAGGFFEELVQAGKLGELKKQLRLKIRKGGGNYYLSLFRLVMGKWFPCFPNLLNGLHLKRDWRQPRFNTFAIDPGIKKHYSLKQRFFRKVGFPEDPDVRRRQYKRIMHDHVPERLEESWLNARRNRIEYRYPFFDVKLIEFYYALPSEFKYRDGLGRYIFRKAMEGILPDEIFRRNDKTGATIPNLPYRLAMDADAFREIIKEARKNNRYHYVDYEKLAENLDLLLDRNTGKRIGFGNRSFFSSIVVLILQKRQREGRINIGIKC